MNLSRVTRWGLRSGGLIAVSALAACNASSPTAPLAAKKVLATPIIFTATSTAWDFTGLIGTANGTQDWGTSKLVTNGTAGSINLTTDGSGTHITTKGKELPVGDTERGLGLCSVATSCGSGGDEVGDHGTGVLYMNLNGVLPAGSELTEIDLGSVQINEGWKVSYSTTGLGGSFTLLSQGEGNGSNNGGDNVSLDVFDILGSTLPTANLVLKFEKNTSATGNATTDNDYVVKSVITSFVPPETLPGRMTGGGGADFPVAGAATAAAPDIKGPDLTFGIEIHCDITLSNNIEINWAGHQWHLEKPITEATCLDNPNIGPLPPVAPFDTFIGKAVGKLDGVAGSHLEFTYVDAGEPGTSDQVQLKIFAPNSSTVVLNLPLTLLANGNIQAHYDQPHGNKP